MSVSSPKTITIFQGQLKWEVIYLQRSGSNLGIRMRKKLTYFYNNVTMKHNHDVRKTLLCYHDNDKIQCYQFIMLSCFDDVMTTL
jgi:hypothetical protein